MPRDADLGLNFLDKPARRRAADRAAAGAAANDSMALGIVGGLGTDQRTRPPLVDVLAAGARGVVDFVLARSHRRPNGCNIRTAASEDSDPLNHKALAMQRDSLCF